MSEMETYKNEIMPLYEFGDKGFNDAILKYYDY
jgi:hypothetical protein